MNIRLMMCCLTLALLAGCAGAEFPPVLPGPQLTATPSPTLVSPTSTPTPSPTPTLTPKPTPTPLPDEVFQSAQLAFHNGDWGTAEMLYTQFLQISPPQGESGVLAMEGLGRVHLATENYAGALEALTPILTGTYDQETTSIAHQIAAEVLMASDQPLEAAPHYAALREVYPVLEAYIYEWEADAYYAASEYELALERYQSSVTATDTATAQARLQEKIGLCNAALGEYEAAIAAYDIAEALYTSENQSARILYQTVETALLFEDALEATQRMLKLVEDYPKQLYAYNALIQLVENEIPVDDMQRGLVDYYAEAYTPAVQAFSRVVNSDPEHDGAPHYFAGLSFLEAGNPALALDEFETLLETHPDDPHWGDAVMGKAEAQAEMGRVYDATRTYRTFANEQPTHPLAPAALWQAADLAEEGGNLSAAAEVLIDLANRYPDDERAPEALFQAGLLYYKATLLQKAQQAWSDLVLWCLKDDLAKSSRIQARLLYYRVELPQEALHICSDPVPWYWYPQDDLAQAAYFWLGKTHLESGEIISSTASFSDAIDINPWNFYGLQAAERQTGILSFTPGLTYPEPINSPEAQDEAEQWLASWLELDPEQPIAMPENVRSDPRLERGSLLLALGYFDAGRAELESLRIAYASDPLAQYTLALHYRDIGLYRSSIISAAAVWRHSPSESLETLPRFIAGLIYPIYYQDLVEQQAANHNLDPLFAFALLRQESLFEGKATSFAAAHGLMQVIPTTGAAIAQALNWPPDYDTPDLYRPHVSVRFGIWYLTQQLPNVDNSLFVAMAGYNGGPGNAFVWWETADRDEDLFVELISFRETKLYVRLIREHYAKYQWLYAE